MIRPEEVSLNIYGRTIQISSQNKRILEEIRRDFSFFLSGESKTPDFTIWAYLDSIPRKKFSPFYLLMKTRYFLCYEIGAVKHVYYSFDDYVRYDYKRNFAEVYSEDLSRLHELVYMVLRSKIGELMEEIGLHRIHALAFSYRKKGVLFIAPMRGGKTTLALSLLKSFPIKLLSDEVPLLDSQCRLYPFPLRIGIWPGTSIPFSSSEHLNIRRFQNRKYGEKILIDIDFFKDKVEKNPIRLCCVFIGKRSKNGEEKCSIRKTNLFILLHVLIVNLILAIGACQVKEYFIKRSLWDFRKKVSIVLARVYLCLKIIVNYTPFVVNLGSDSKNNAQTIMDFLRTFPHPKM